MSIARHHAEWLSLVEVSGPFLSMPVLLKVFPQGLDAHDPDHLRSLRLAYEEWEDHQADPDPKFHQAWVRYVLTQTLELPVGRLVAGQQIPQTLNVPVGEHGEVLKPDLAVMGNDKPRLLVHVLSPGQHLEKPLSEHRWKASAATRMMELLHGTGCRLGLVTNGERWMLVDAPRGETTGFASWYASYWLEEPITLRAFRTLLCARRFFSVPDGETLEAMLAESANNQQEVTDQLGYQVRKAVEVLIQSLDRADQDHGRQLLEKVSEEELYRAALTVMMRLVFLFSAEERGLLLLGDPLYDQHYAVSTLRAQLREAADQHGEEVLERRLDAWCRLLTTFRAVHCGAWHERLKLPAYGGDLFNPDRFPFLEGRPVRDTPLPVNNRTVLHLLEALQILQVKVPGGGPAEARRLSFRALDIEQIGHVYEGLLDHTAKRAKEPYLGLLGTKDKEPEVPLAELERLRKKGEDDLLKYLKEETGKSESALKNALAVSVEGLEVGRFRSACGNDEKLWERVKPLVGLVRQDTFDYPVVIPPGSVYVTEGTDRRTSGTHYTPKSLTEPIVQYTLEPVVYVGPAEGKPKDEWKLRSARDLLNLKICDMATGSGAFLVQACRFLAERLLEAWEEAEGSAGSRQQRLDFSSKKADVPAAKNRPGITPFGDTATGKLHEQLIPTDVDERMTYARRLIAQRCLYGVDKNPLAVEMAKLSLWLLTMARDLPFTFLDHAIRCGDSLVGIHELKQLENLTLTGEKQFAPVFLESLQSSIRQAIVLRNRLAEIVPNDPERVAEQERLFHETQELTAKLRASADLVIADAFDGEQNGVVTVVARFRDSTAASLQAEANRQLHTRLTFHWPLEFPEVFEGRGGFDAIVGNPPFLGGIRIRGSLGAVYLQVLQTLWGGGNRADLCAYFLVRATDLLRGNGSFGLLATNTIAQGDTRQFGLERIISENSSIYRAVSSRKWPGTANLEVAQVWIKKGEWPGPFILNERPVSGITPFLVEKSTVAGHPHNLVENQSCSFKGVDPMGTGFLLEPDEAKSLLHSDSASSEVLLPFLNGQDLYSQPDQASSRWAIYFRNWPLDKSTAEKGYHGPVASDYPMCLNIVSQRVKPYRQQVRAGGEYVLGNTLANKWWVFNRPRLELFSQISRLRRVVVRPEVSNTHAMVFLPPTILFSNVVCVFCFEDGGHFAVLQSSFHEAWARHYSSSMRTDMRYTTADCFEPFPFPKNLRVLEERGENYHEHRRQVMLARKLGLTKTYNRFHARQEDATDIVKLRQLHFEMDQAVAAAYGWTDLDLGHGFHPTKQGERYTISEAARREVLARLLKLNHERYAEEVAQGLHDGKKRAGNKRTPRGKSAGRTFFDDGEKEEAEDEKPASAEIATEKVGETGVHDAEAEQAARPRPIEDFDTDAIMAAFRQVARGKGWQEREELFKAVSQLLGYQRVSPKVREALKGHLRAAIRRKIIEAEGDQVRAGTATMDQYDLEDLRATLCSVMRSGREYERQEVIHAVARYLGFVRVTETVLQSLKSAINSGIRQGILAYEGDRIWRK